jgi:hypothetical protein
MRDRPNRSSAPAAALVPPALAAARSPTSNTVTRPGYQEVTAGNTIELYDPANNTIYTTTLQAEQRAIIAHIRSTAAPGTYDPVEQITRTTLPGTTIMVVARWQRYQVLDATPANRRVLSLRALHPSARMVDDARAYVNASQGAVYTSTTRG